MIAKGFTHHGPDSQIGNIMIVHNVEMHNVGTRFEHVIYLFSQSGEVSSKYGGSNQKISHKTPWISSGAMMRDFHCGCKLFALFITSKMGT